MGTETILFFGAHYEIKNPGQNQVETKYYLAGGSRVAMRSYTVPQNSTLTYLMGDHLGSTSLAVNASTGAVTETRYKAWGEVRYTTPNVTLPTRNTFTGQYSYVSDDATDLGSSIRDVLWRVDKACPIRGTHLRSLAPPVICLAYQAGVSQLQVSGVLRESEPRFTSRSSPAQYRITGQSKSTHRERGREITLRWEIPAAYAPGQSPPTSL